jgi:hypothetical protein
MRLADNGISDEQNDMDYDGIEDSIDIFKREIGKGKALFTMRDWCALAPYFCSLNPS